MSSNVIEWAKEQWTELKRKEFNQWSRDSVVKPRPQELQKLKWQITCQEGMLVRGRMSKWEDDIYGDFFNDAYRVFTDDVYVLLSQQGDSWLTLTPKDGIQLVKESEFLSINAIPFFRTNEEQEKFQRQEHDEELAEIEAYRTPEEPLVPGLDYEEAS